MSRTIYVDDDHADRADLVEPVDFRIDLICGAALGRGAECDRRRAELVLSAGVLLIFGPTAGIINRAPGANPYDHLDSASSSLPGAAHQVWMGYPIGYDFDADPDHAQALWKVRFRGCLEHNPTPDVAALATGLRATLVTLEKANMPSMPLTIGQLDVALAHAT